MSVPTNISEGAVDPPTMRRTMGRFATGVAVITTLALSDYGVVFAVPYGTLTVFVGVAVLAGILAAILPARRAAKLNVLEALQYE